MRANPCVFALICVALLLVPASAADYHVAPTDGGPPHDELAPEILQLVSPKGFKVVRGSSRTICEIWPCKTWVINSSSQQDPEIQYPFQPGQLFGVIRFPRKGSDFRDQEIESGVYTLRYALQPVDGDHTGTSPTRDFLVMIRAEDDRSPAPPDQQTLQDQSAEAAQSNHPAMLWLPPMKGPAPPEPTIRHDEEHDWWMVQFQGQVQEGDKTRSLPIELVVVGATEE